MRIYRIAAAAGFAILAHAAPLLAQADTRQEEERLRSAAVTFPHAKRELACLLYRSGTSTAIAEASRHMRDAADAGDFAAMLYASAYFRTGTGVSRNSAVADALLLAMRDGIARSAPFPLTSPDDARAALLRGDCAPADEAGAEQVLKNSIPLGRLS